MLLIYPRLAGPWLPELTRCQFIIYNFIFIIQIPIALRLYGKYKHAMPGSWFSFYTGFYRVIDF